MAHSCPECGQTCYCGGDIDDINFGETSACDHCLVFGEDEDEDFYAYMDEIRERERENGA